MRAGSDGSSSGHGVFGSRRAQRQLSARRAAGLTVVVLCGSLAATAATAAPAARAPAPAPAPIITTAAGTGVYGYGGDGNPSTQALLAQPAGVAVDGAGNVYIADIGNSVIRRVTPGGVIDTVAGTPRTPGFSGDGGPATAALLDGPLDVAVDSAGDVYIADSGNNRIRKLDAATGVIATVAGNGEFGYGGDGGPATDATLAFPQGVTIDAIGDLSIADSFNSVVRRVDASAGVITTVAGIPGRFDFSGDGGPATAAALSSPTDVAVDAAGNLYVADNGNYRVRKVSPAGIITSVAGSGQPGSSGDGGPATAARMTPTGLAVDRSGSLFVSDSASGRVREVTTSTGTVTTAAGGGLPADGVGDGAAATVSDLEAPYRLAVDVGDNLFIADLGDNRVRVVGSLFVTVADSPEPVPAGGPLTYTVSVSNVSSTSARRVAVTDSLAPTALFVSAVPSQGSCLQAGGTLRCAFGTLRPGVTATVTILVTAPANQNLSNRVSFAALHPERYFLDNTDTEATSVAMAALGLTKVDGPDPVEVDEPLRYTLSVFNGLPGQATGVILTDTLPAEVAFVSAAPTQGSCAHTAGVVTCVLGGLQYQARATVAIDVRAVEHGVVMNTATVRSTEHPAGTTATSDTQVLDPACGQIIDTDTTLTADIGPCEADGLIAGADGIALNLGGHRVFGTTGPSPGDPDSGVPAGVAAGIRLPARTGVTVTNGTVADFDAGVVVNEGGSNTITELTVRDNIGIDDAFNAELGDGIILFDSADNLIADNTVVHNGIFDGIGVLGGGSSGNTIRDNVVQDTVGPADGGQAGQGILVNAAEGNGLPTSITGVNVTANLVTGNAAAGISNVNSIDGVVSGNTVIGNGLTHLGGNGIGVSQGAGSNVPATRMLIENNEIHGNGEDGIQIFSLENQIIGNDAADNAVKPSPFPAFPFFDLHDGYPDCDSNIWSGNTYGSGGFSPACVLDGLSPAPGAGAEESHVPPPPARRRLGSS